MSLHDELATSPPCKLCQFLSDIAPSERAAWEVELAQPVTVVGNTKVVRALARRGTLVTETSVRRHRAKHVR